LGTQKGTTDLIERKGQGRLDRKTRTSNFHNFWSKYGTSNERRKIWCL